mgnify:FL=1
MNGNFDLGEVNPLRYFAAVAVVTGLLFAFIAGGDGEASPLPLRLLQWQLQSCLPMALLVASQLLLSQLHPFARLNRWLQLALSGLLGASLFTPLALCIDFWLHASEVSWAELADEFTGVAPPVTVFWLAVNAPWVLGFRLRQEGGVTDQASVDQPPRGVVAHAPPMPRFLQQVPEGLSGELMYLEAELHYLAVVTRQGRALILYNLRDAIDELESLPGIQPHRSYWVAASAVTGLHREGRNGQLKMQNGDRVPISRRKLSLVREWYEQLEQVGRG